MWIILMKIEFFCEVIHSFFEFNGKMCVLQM
ncbi:hypothetical protein BGX16_1285 [Hallerella succinigenes]|uniref:Uncharacterized protein n=1 Tax=Hallerella succinigenes TaxID=1896222 RepID=A0A2M9A6I5_9BACT|nr:hypothetical protein BGX16_1285 [Hallerella succinigenes]